MKRRSTAATLILLLTTFGVQLPDPVGAQAISTGQATLPSSDVLGDCSGAVPVIVASDAAAQSDIYSAVTLAGVLGSDSCIVLAGARDEPFPQSQIDRLNTAASDGYVVGGTAAVPEAKLAGRKATRVSGADRWETAIAVGAVAAALAAGTDPTVSGNGRQPDDSTPAWQQRLVTEFSAALRSDVAPTAMCMSLYRNGTPIFQHQSNASLLPASLMKLATVTAALNELGADATFTTQVVAGSGALDAVNDGVLRGDLYLIGGGDPVLATPGYINRIAAERPYTDVTKLADSVVAALEARGIDTIDGAIVGDGSWFADGEQTYTSHSLADAAADTPPVWKPSYLSDNLVGVLSGLVINDGYSPYTVSRRSHTRSADATEAAAADFDDLLEERGMVIRKRPRSGNAPAAGETASLASIASPPLVRILVRILRYSENTPAEMLLKQIGRHHGDSSRAAAAAAASAALGEILGTTADEITIVDGSGLSVHNRMSCEATVQLLLHAGADSRLVASLSIAGRTPTLRDCGPQSAAESSSTSTSPTSTNPTSTNPTSINTVFAKGGQLNDSSAVAGVSVAPNGDALTFAMIANEPLIFLRLGSCNPLRQLTLNAIGRYTYGPSNGPNS